MIPKGILLTAVFSAAFFVASAEEAPAQNRVNERDNFRNTSYIRSDDDVMKTHLFLADEACRGRDYPECVANLMRALRRGGDALVSFGDRTYLTGRMAALRRLASLPPEGFSLYLEASAEESERELAAAMELRNEALLREGIARFPFTAKTFTALKMLGDLSRERGDCLEAAGRYRRYLEHAGFAAGNAAPDPSEESAVRLSLYLALLGAGRLEEAEPFAPAGPVRVGEREMSVKELVEAFARKSECEAEAEGGWPTQGGGRARARLPSFDCGSLRLLWSYPLKDEVERKRRIESITIREQAGLDARRLGSSVYPVVYGGRLFVFDERGFHALDLETGEAAFGPIPWDWSLLFGDEEPNLENVSYSGTAAQDVFYVALNHRGSKSPYSRAEHLGTLLALDLAREGACIWKRGGLEEVAGDAGEPDDSAQDGSLENAAKSASESAPERGGPGGGDFFKGLSFSGAPVVLEGRVYLMATRHTATAAEAWLLCFDAARGTLLFGRFLCSGVEIWKFGGRADLDDPSLHDRVELGAPIVENGGVLFCLTNLGVAAAVDAFSGEIIWLFKYNRIFAQDPATYERAFFYDTGGWEDSLPLFRDGRFIFAPADSRFLYTLAPAPDPEGFIVLDDPVEKGRFVSFIGTDGGLFYFTAREGGRNFIAAAERSGALVWETELFAVEDRITGQPLLTRTALFVPTLRHIYRVDLAAEGLVTHSFPAPMPDREPGENRQDLRSPLFGNIITTKDRLISVSDTKILVFAPD